MRDACAGLLVIALATVSCKSNADKPPTMEALGCSLSTQLLDGALGPSATPLDVSRLTHPDTCIYRRNGRSLAIVKFASLEASQQHRELFKREASKVTNVGEEAYFAQGGRVTQLMAYRGTTAILIESRGEAASVLAASVTQVLDSVAPR